MADEKWTVERTMAALGVCRATLHNWSRSGTLRKYIEPKGSGRGGRRVFYNPAEVKELARRLKLEQAVYDALPTEKANELYGLLRSYDVDIDTFVAAAEKHAYQRALERQKHSLQSR